VHSDGGVSYKTLLFNVTNPSESFFSLDISVSNQHLLYADPEPALKMNSDPYPRHTLKKKTFL
jgi:hypothetical protein